MAWVWETLYDIVAGKRVAANDMPWKLTLNDLIESNIKLAPVPFYFCVSTRGNLGQRYCKFCSIYFVTKNALAAKVCFPQPDVVVEYDAQDLPGDEDHREPVQVPEEGRVPRNVFDIFLNAFEEDA